MAHDKFLSKPLVVALISTALVGQARADQGSELRSWRVPEQDAANVIALTMKLAGHRPEYADIVDGLPSENISFLDMQRTIRSLGAVATFEKPNLDERWEASLPAIALLDEPGLQRGGFALLFAVTDKEAFWIEGSYVRPIHASRDEFLRKWSGHLLVVSPPQAGFALNSLAFILPAALFGVYVLARSRRREPVRTELEPAPRETDWITLGEKGQCG